MKIRPYQPTDYEQIKVLLTAPDTYGGVFDEARDSADRLASLEAAKPNSILVAETDRQVVGTVTLFEDGRAAWLYRFAVSRIQEEATRLLKDAAVAELQARGHTQVLVYAPQGDQHFEDRYAALGFTKGTDFTAYWQELPERSVFVEQVSALDLAKEYFAHSNARDLDAIEKMLTNTTTYSSPNVGVFLGKAQIMEMKRGFYGSFTDMHWDVHSAEETKPGVVLFDFTFTGTKTDGEKVERSGLEYVIVHNGKLQHIEVRNK